MLHVAYDPHHFQLRLDDAEIDVLSDGVFVGEKFLRELFVDYHCTGRMLVVGLPQESPALQRNSHRVQVALFHEIEKRDLHVRRIGRLRLPLKPKRQFIIALHRQRTPGQ